MRKILLLLFVFICSYSIPEKSIYALKFKSLDREDIDMASYKGKKILVAVFNAGNPDRKLLRSLDTLFRETQTILSIIAVPAEDFSTAMPEKMLVSLLRDSLNLSYPVTAIRRVKKNNENAQHPLLQWLTSKDNNQHFDEDVEDGGQMYIVNETGILFANIKKGVFPTEKLIKDILGQQVYE
ncbi:glutathione peroxidase [Hydrobacter penzbergensis]|uniref:Glutathione peroxidase n=1 Tax=Hydrobacter penzbergensis TaxID=1235997 RepID=A0A8X8IIR7_9BACT|nr:hypothetical protein [Hydrobacter penzbergensis]SDX69911.1 glutathione peroxidase [Hydrobacter penzbergensis]